MAIDQSIWLIDTNIEKQREIRLDNEKELEDVLEKNLELLNDGWMVIGRQVLTDYQKYIDLLAIDADGSIIVIELKKDRTPRDVVAQVIDYGSWVKKLDSEKIASIYEEYSERRGATKSFDQSFKEKFNKKLDEESLNNSHQLVVVASALDDSTERIVSYLSDEGIAINILFFKIFSINNKKFLSRAWYIDPIETLTNATEKIGNQPWNGEYYSSFGDGDTRAWSDAYKYGFISAGGGEWYSRTLKILKIGDRVWVNIPHIGYVGAGKVVDTARLAKDVILEDNKNIFELSGIKGSYKNTEKEGSDTEEYMVKVEWIKKVKKEDAIKETGFFGNQNSVCRPGSNKWSHTVDRLKEIWGIK